jgi:nanoRNase/pAp phosphatase (c-di-AMP/oligoRNAs hydrolase)
MNKMERHIIDKLRGEDLFYYFTHEHPDKDYASVVELLPYALLWDMEKAYSVLERVVKENKTLVAVYPAFGNIDTSGMEYVGDILDGGLYISSRPYFSE